MKTRFAVFAVLAGMSASPAAAQFLVVNPNAGAVVTTAARTGAPVGDSVFWGADVTPSTQRDRIERARMVDDRFPGLRQELAGLSAPMARYRYERAEKAARWQRIRALEARD